MFSFKKREPGSANPAAPVNSRNPENFVRTFREDLENFGKEIPGDNFLPDVPEKARTSSELFQSLPTPPPLAPSQPPPMNMEPAKRPLSRETAPGTSSLPDFPSSASQSFFERKPATEQIPQAAEEMRAVPKKSGGEKAVFAILFLLLMAAGAGFYYYWFILGKSFSFSSLFSTPSSDQTPPAAPPAAPDNLSDSQNKNLRRLVVDVSQSPAETKNTVRNFTADFLSSAADDDMIEIKILNKDEQPATKKNFITAFGLMIPETVSGKLSEDFSLFVKKEHDLAKPGLVFKTVTSAGLAEALKNWEPTMPSDLNFLYLEQNPSPATFSFNSSRYKNADIRYFNFSSPINTSFDYSVISNFLVIGTSKDSIRSTLDYMSEK